MKSFVTTTFCALSVAVLVLSINSRANADWEDGVLETVGTPTANHFGYGAHSSDAETKIDLAPIEDLPPAEFGIATSEAYANPSYIPAYGYGYANMTLRRVCSWTGGGTPSSITWDDIWAWSISETGDWGIGIATFGSTNLTSYAGTLMNHGTANTTNTSFTIQGSITSSSQAGDPMNIYIVGPYSASATASRTFKVHVD